MLRVAWRMLRQRPASLIATLVALCFAVAMVTACGVMLESGLRFHGASPRYAAAPVLVATTDVATTDGSGSDREVVSDPLAERGQLDSSLVGRIATVPGVRAAIPDVAVPVQVIAGSGAAPAEVHPWAAARLTPFALWAGSAPATGGDVVLGQPLAASLGVRPGQRVQLRLTTGLTTFVVSGIAASAGPPPLAPTVFVDGAEAQTLAGRPGQADVIGVLADPGVRTGALADAVRRVLPPVPTRPAGAYPRVYAGADRGAVELVGGAAASGTVIAVSAAAGGSVLLIATLVIAGTVGLSVTQRHRDIALLRAIAATPRQVRRMVVCETAMLAVVSGAAGVWPGLAGVSWLRGQFVSHGLVPATFRLHVSWLPPLVAASAGLFIAVVAAWIASLRTSRVRPSEALGETAAERTGPGVVRTVLALIALAGGITLSIVTAHAGGNAVGVMVPAVFVLVVAVALGSPLLLRGTALTAGRALYGFGVTGRLAAANTATSARRLSAVVGSLVLAVALGGSMWFVPGSEQHAAAQQRRAGLVAGYVVTAPAPGLQPGVTTVIRHTPGVTAATGVVGSTIFPRQGDDDYTAQGVDAGALSRTLDLGVTSGSLAGLHGNTVAVDTQTAQELHVHVGSWFRGWFGDGTPAGLRVVAVYTRGLGFAQMTVPHDVLIGHTTTRLDSAVYVATAAGRPGMVAALRAELLRVAPGSSLRARAAYQVALDEDLAVNAWTSQLIAAALVVYVLIAAVNTLLMAAMARRREFAVLRLAGTTRNQVLRMACLEQTLLLGLALVLGGAIAAATLVPAVKATTGLTVPYVPVTGWVVVIGGTILLGSLAMIMPVRWILRTPPVEAIGIRE
jgi:putative ABC transport system permease protein